MIQKLSKSMDEQIARILQKEPDALTEEELRLLAQMSLPDPSSAESSGGDDEEDEEEDSGGGDDPQEQEEEERDGKEASVTGTATAAPPPPTDLVELMERRRSSDVRVARTPLAGRPGAAPAAGPSRTPGVFDVLTRADCVGGPEAVAEAVLRVHHVDMAGRGLSSVDAVACFLNVTHLYLQHNAIAALDDLALLPSLSTLVVHHNRVASLAPLAELPRLVYLDAAHNRVSALEGVPASLEYLDLRGNLCSGGAAGEYRDWLLASCPRLRTLDGAAVGGSDDGEGSDTESGGGGSSAGGDDTAAAAVTPTERSRTAPPRTRGSASRSRAARMALEVRETATPPPLPTRPGGSGGGGGSGGRRGTNDEEEETKAAEAYLGSGVFMTANEDRILAQYEARVARRREQYRLPSGGTAGPGATSAASALGAQLGEDAADIAAGGATASEEPRARLYADVQYANAAAQNRVRREVEQYWEDIGKMSRTRRALAAERKRRLGDTAAQPSAGYREALALLEKEGHQDIDNYRKPREDNSKPAVK